MNKDQIKELLKSKKVKAALVALALALAEILGPEETQLVSKLLEIIG